MILLLEVLLLGLTELSRDSCLSVRTIIEPLISKILGVSNWGRDIQIPAKEVVWTLGELVCIGTF